MTHDRLTNNDRPDGRDDTYTESRHQMSTTKTTAPQGAPTTTTKKRTGGGKRLAIILGLVAAAFMTSYVYAASSAPKTVGTDTGAVLTPAAASGDAAASGCACCGGSGGGPEVSAATKVTGDVQTIKVDTSQGTFDPSRIEAKAGIPIEIEFSQAPGGCLSAVLFPDFGIDEDLTAGPKTVKIPAQKAGEYAFSCQMQMVFGTLVVQ